MRERKKQQALTGNRPLTEEALSEFERRVVAIIGTEYVEGHESVAENVPMEEVSYSEVNMYDEKSKFLFY